MNDLANYLVTLSRPSSLHPTLLSNFDSCRKGAVQAPRWNVMFAIGLENAPSLLALYILMLPFLEVGLPLSETYSSILNFAFFTLSRH